MLMLMLTFSFVRLWVLSTCFLLLSLFASSELTSVIELLHILTVACYDYLLYPHVRPLYRVMPICWNECTELFLALDIYDLRLLQLTVKMLCNHKQSVSWVKHFLGRKLKFSNR